MPIYAYKCGSCGHAKDVLQKISDEPLSVCPSCGAPAFTKQLTAAGFQLKGSGWYATDFRNGSSPAPAADAAKPADGEAKPADSKAADSKPADSKHDNGANTAPAAKPSGPTASGGAACASH